MSWVTLLLALLAGCGKQEAPPYKAVSLNVSLELLQAYENNDQELAARKLERLTDIMPDAPGIFELTEDQINQSALSTAETHLQTGELQEAKEAIVIAIREHGASASLKQAKEQLDALLSIQTYLDTPTSELATTAATRLAALPQPSFFSDVQLYHEWHQAESMRVAELLAEMKRQRIAKVESTLDFRLVTFSTEVQDDLKDLSLLTTDHPVGTIWRKLTSGSLMISEIEQIEDPKSREMAIFSVMFYPIYTHAGEPNPLRIPDDLLRLAADQTGISQSGRFAKAYASFMIGRRQSGLKALVELHTHDPDHLVDLSLIVQRMPKIKAIRGVGLTNVLNALSQGKSP